MNKHWLSIWLSGMLFLFALLLSLALVACESADEGVSEREQGDENNSEVDEGFGEGEGGSGSDETTAGEGELEQAPPAASPVAPELLSTRTQEEGAEIEVQGTAEAETTAEPGTTTDVEQEMLENTPEFDLDSAFALNGIHMDEGRRSQLAGYWGLEPASGDDDPGKRWRE